MNRKDVKTLLYNYHAVFEEELETKQRMLTFIDQYPNCFERTLLIGHITASAWLLSRDFQSVLLMHHKKLDNWFQFGGHCDGNPDVLAVAIREAQEESGIINIVPVMKDIFDIDIHRIPARAHEPEHDHFDIRFLLQIAADESFEKNNESNELRWFSITDALPSEEESLLRMKRKWELFLSSKNPATTEDINRRSIV